MGKVGTRHEERGIHLSIMVGWMGKSEIRDTEFWKIDNATACWDCIMGSETSFWGLVKS